MLHEDCQFPLPTRPSGAGAFMITSYVRRTVLRVHDYGHALWGNALHGLISLSENLVRYEVDDVCKVYKY